MSDADEITEVGLLEGIIRRPAMYWGDSDNHFHSFVAFLSGYGLGQGDHLDEEARQQLDDVIPPRFHEFVTEYYGHKFPHGGYGWTTFIEENSNSDQEALSLFLKLRRLYDEQNEGEQDDAGKPDPAAS